MTQDPRVNRQLHNVLGPASAEIGCDECFDQLDAYVEAEFAGRPADEAFPGLRAHLAGCPACREDHDSLHALLLADEHPPGRR